MPRPGRNTTVLSKNEVYLLKSGKMLTRELADLIGKEAGLDTSRRSYDSLNEEQIDDLEFGGKRLIHKNPIYAPYIDNNEPYPPMLMFFSSSPSELRSVYTINLNTLKPTVNSLIKAKIPDCILLNLQ